MLCCSKLAPTCCMIRVHANCNSDVNVLYADMPYSSSKESVPSAQGQQVSSRACSRCTAGCIRPESISIVCRHSEPNSTIVAASCIPQHNTFLQKVWSLDSSRMQTCTDACSSAVTAVMTAILLISNGSMLCKHRFKLESRVSGNC